MPIHKQGRAQSNTNTRDTDRSVIPQISLKAQIIGILRTQKAFARTANVLRKFATSMHRKSHLYG
jgi:hypothetical protein